MPPAENLTGRVFGRLTVVERGPNTHDDRVQWRCLCSCGDTAVVTRKNLVAGSARSCGCLHRELAGERMRKLRASRS